MRYPPIFPSEKPKPTTVATTATALNTTEAPESSNTSSSNANNSTSNNTADGASSTSSNDTSRRKRSRYYGNEENILEVDLDTTTPGSKALDKSTGYNYINVEVVTLISQYFS